MILGEQIWLTAAQDDGESFYALCVDKTTGAVIHDVLVVTNDRPGRVHATNSPASPTAILEGDRVYVHFGANGTACLTTDGEILWTVKLPHAQLYGPSSTPVLYKDLLIVPCHGTDVRYFVALDTKTGKERWKRSRGGRWSESTPLIIHTAQGDQLICNLADGVVALDPATGAELWSVDQKGNYAQVPRPVFGNGMVFVCGGYFGPLVQAIRPDGRGNVTRSHVAWSLQHASVSLNPSPLLVDNDLYMVSDKGIASCFDAMTGKLHWRKRIDGTYYASPVSADGRIYFFNNSGTTRVIKPGPKLVVLATSKLDGRIMASPAIVDNAIYLRTDRHLYRLEEKAAEEK